MLETNTITISSDLKKFPEAFFRIGYTPRNDFFKEKSGKNPASNKTFYSKYRLTPFNIMLS